MTETDDFIAAAKSAIDKWAALSARQDELQVDAKRAAEELNKARCATDDAFDQARKLCGEMLRMTPVVVVNERSEA